METEQKTIPEGYTGMYSQTIFITEEDVNPALYNLKFSQYMKSKGALQVLEGCKDNPDKMKNIAYFHPEYSAYVEYDSSKNRSKFGIQITQSIDSNDLILEDIIENFPEFRKLSPRKIGVRDPSTEAHCF